MVETHIDISSVAGETAIDKETITSQDGSIIVTETDNGVDLSVDIPIVTEEVDGLESHTDKALRDHSFTNIAMKGIYKDADAAIKALQNIDSQYSPQHGQAIQFTDTDGNVRLFRYFGYYEIERNGSGREWVDCAFDEKHAKWCILKYTKVGDLTVATAKADASLWTVKENILGSQERWFKLTSGDGKLIALSGNISQEYAVSEDGGESWKLYSNIPSAYWVSIKYGMDKWWFCGESSLYTTTDFKTFENLSSGISSIGTCSDIAVGKSRAYIISTLSSTKTLYSYDADTKKVVAEYVLSTENRINQVITTDGADILALGSNIGYAIKNYTSRILRCTDNGCTTLYQNSALTLCGMMISQDLSHVVEIHHTKLVLVDLSTKKSTDIALPESVTNFSNFAVNGNELLVVNGQHKEGDSGSGNFAFLIDMLTGKILNSEWSEIPILSSNKNTLLASNDGEFANVSLGGHLTYSEASKTLSTENSDRYEEYENYRLSDGDTSLFVTNELSAIAIGDAVYSDEQCATQIGTVENVHHNPNNPNDVVVKTNEDSDVFRFVGKQLDSLANSQAVANLWERVKNYSSDTFYTKEQTYTKEQVNELVDVKISYKVVTELPETGESGIIYFVPPITRTTQNEYEEYMWIDEAFELIGTTKVDLSDYYTIEEVDNAMQAESDERKADDAKLLPLAGGTMEGNIVTDANASITTSYYKEITSAEAKWVRLFSITFNADPESSSFSFFGKGRWNRSGSHYVELFVSFKENLSYLYDTQMSFGAEYGWNQRVYYFKKDTNKENTYEIWFEYRGDWEDLHILNVAGNRKFMESATFSFIGDIYDDKPDGLSRGQCGVVARNAILDGNSKNISETYAQKTDVYTKTEADTLLSSKADKSAVERSILEITDDNKDTYIQKFKDDLNVGEERYIVIDKEYDTIVFATSNNSTISSISGIRPTDELGSFSQGYITTIIGADGNQCNVYLSQAGQEQGRPYSFSKYLYAHMGLEQHSVGGFYQFMHYNGTWFSKSY